MLRLTRGAEPEGVPELLIDPELKGYGELKWLPELTRCVELGRVVGELRETVALVLARDPVLARDAEDAIEVAKFDRDVRELCGPTALVFIREAEVIELS